MYTNIAACLGCKDDVLRCTDTAALICVDAHVPDAAVNVQSKDMNVTALWKNRAVKCADFTTPEKAVCTTNYALRVETRGGVCVTCKTRRWTGVYP